jgi:hypothetical protein
MEWFERTIDFAWDYFAARPLIVYDTLATEGAAIIAAAWEWLTL